MNDWGAIWTATWNTITIGVAVAALSGLFGIILAWLVTRTHLPGHRALGSLLSLPYALPPYLLGMAWLMLGNPTVGLVKDWIPGATGTYGFWGIVLVLTFGAFAYPYMELRAGFEKMDAALEEAARMSGASPARVF